MKLKYINFFLLAVIIAFNIQSLYIEDIFHVKMVGESLSMEFEGEEGDLQRLSTYLLWGSIITNTILVWFAGLGISKLFTLIKRKINGNNKTQTT